MTDEYTHNSGIWRKFLRRHWGMAVLLAIGAALAIIGAVLVFLWFASDAQTTGLVPATLNLWTMGNVIMFILNLIFWELVLVGIPVVAAIIVFYAGYRRLPAEERDEYRRGGLWRSRSRGRNFGNGFTFLVNLGFVIKVFTDGNWNLPFSNWTFDYLVSSYVIVLVVIAIIFAVPILIGGTWWLRREIRS
jgi:hypothetical protein